MFKVLHIKLSIVIIGFFITSIPNINAQSKNMIDGNLYAEHRFKTYNSGAFLLPITDLHCMNLRCLSICRDRLHLNLSRFNMENILKNNYTQTKLFDFSFENTDTLRSSIMDRHSYNLTPPNINFHYTPYPTTLQGLGILLMGISRMVLFPAAPDYKVDACDF